MMKIKEKFIDKQQYAAKGSLTLDAIFILQLQLNWREMSQQMKEEQHIDIQAEGENQQQEQEMIQAEEFLEDLQQHSQRMIEKLDKEQGAQQEGVQHVMIKNPISPYMMFIKTWRINHPTQKFNVSNMGLIWKSMSLSEKQPYQAEYLERRQQYDLQQATIQMSNLNNPGSDLSTPKYFYPLARVKAIMRQDTFYAPKVEATLAMAKAAEYFTEYILEETKKITQGQHRIDAKAFFDCINNNRSISFLQCLIEEFNKDDSEGNKQKKQKPNIRLEFEPTPKASDRAEKADKAEYHEKPAQKSEVKPKLRSSSKPTGTGLQMSLDTFVMKQR